MPSGCQAGLDTGCPARSQVTTLPELPFSPSCILVRIRDPQYYRVIQSRLAVAIPWALCSLPFKGIVFLSQYAKIRTLNRPRMPLFISFPIRNPWSFYSSLLELCSWGSVYKYIQNETKFLCFRLTGLVMLAVYISELQGSVIFIRSSLHSKNRTPYVGSFIWDLVSAPKYSDLLSFIWY